MMALITSYLMLLCGPAVSTAQIEGRVKISGYAGFVPSIASDNVRVLNAQS